MAEALERRRARGGTGRGGLGCLVLALACAAPSWAEETLFEGTLTRGAGGDFDGSYGYVAPGLIGFRGSLEPPRFTFSGVEYTVETLEISTGSGIGFSTTPTLPATGMTLSLPTFRTTGTATTRCPAGGQEAYALENYVTRTLREKGCLDADDWVENLATTGEVRLTFAGVEPDDVLVGNRGQRRHGMQQAATRNLLQRFRTGAAAEYLVTAVEIPTTATPFTPAIHAVDDGGGRGDLVARLTRPAAFVAGANRFAAPAGTVLAADTEYFVHVPKTPGLEIGTTGSAAEDPWSVDGWSLTHTVEAEGAADIPATSMRLRILGGARAELLEATLTRGEVGSDNEYGYVAPGGSEPGGSLVPSTFALADVQYTVQVLTVSTGTHGVIRFWTTPGLPAPGVTLSLPTFRTAMTTRCPAGGQESFAIEDYAKVLFQAKGCLDDERWARDLATTGQVGLTFVGEPPGDVLVGNDGQRSRTDRAGNTRHLLQRFRTGSAADEYLVTSVDLHTSATAFTPSIHAVDDMDGKGDRVAELIRPATVVAGRNRFAAPADTRLDGDTEYFVRIPRTSALEVEATVFDEEDPWSAAGWSIAHSVEGETGDPTAELAVRLRIRGRPVIPNAAPAFAAGTRMRTLVENGGAGIALGSPVVATDADNDTPTYSLAGDAADLFTIDGGGQVRTREGASYDHETSRVNGLVFRVEARDGNGGVGIVGVSVEVTDVDEQSATPAAPRVSATAGSETSLDVAWVAPDINGGPEIEGYDVQYRQGTDGDWSDWTHDGAARTTRITGRTRGTDYQVRVRALNDETPSDWSPPGLGTTNGDNSAPTFPAGPLTRSVVENSAANTNVGAAVVATDANGDTLSYSLGGADAAAFAIDAATGQITTASGVDYDHETRSAYAVAVNADDGNRGTGLVAVNVTVTDVDEQSATPAAPTVTPSPGSRTSVDVAWAEPAQNGGPAIAGYDVQFRADPGDSWTDWTHDGTGTRTTITGRTANTEHQARVRALNGETPSDWSAPGSGRTNNATGAPAISGPALVGAALAVSTAGISDPDGLSSPAFAYQWIRVDADGTSNATDIAAATGPVYVAAAAELGRRLRVRVLFSDDAGNREGLTGDAFPAVGTIEAAPVCVAPDLTGRRLVWTSELQVGRRTADGTSYQGFDTSPAMGGLSPRSFVLGADNHTANGVVLESGSGDGWRLSLALTDAPSAAEQRAATLYVCAAAFALRDATYMEVAGEPTWSWDESGLDWSNVGARTLRLGVDETAPELRRATAYGSGVSLTYDEPLDETSAPAPGAFAVEADGASVAVARVAVAGGRVTLELAAPLLPGQTVTVTYTVPSTNPLRDEAGNAAAALADEAVDNRTSDAVQGDLRLEDGPTESEGRLEIFALDPNAGADERPRWGTVCDDRFTSWSRPRGGGPAEPNRASFVACRILGYEGGEFVSGHDIFSHDSLEETPIWLDDVRCLAGDPAHKAGDGDSPVSLLDCYHAGLARHNCAHAEDVAVRCTGTLGDPPNQGPGLTFGAVDTDGRGVVLTFDEPLDADRPPATGAFVVSGDGVLNAVTAVDAPGTGGLGANELRLGVERVIEPGERVDVIYSDPSDGDDDAAIQDESGVDGPSFHRKVANERVAGGQNPGNGGQNNPVEGPVTASFTDVPAAHDGETGIAPRIALDAALSTSWTGVRDALAVTGGVLTRVQRVDGRSDLWSVEVTPSGAADLTVRLNASPECGDPATTMCTADGRRVETAIETTVPGPGEEVDETPLTVSIADMPAEHGGADAVFAFRLTFSEPLASSYSYETMRDHSLGVWQGRHLRATNARRLEPPGNRYWEITITPINAQDLAISLGPTFECTDTGAMCTDDGRKLSNAFTRLVRGPTPNGIVGGDALSMIWPSPRDGFGSPAATDFAVRVDGAPRAVTAAALAGRTAMLLLAAPVSAENVVTVGYLGSAMHPLADASGIVRSAPWFDLAVENVTGTDTPVAAPDAEQRPDDPLAAASDGTRVLDASGLGLTDLAGLARLAALARLDLSGNAVADLAPLAGLTALRDLDLSGNRVADLGPLSALHGLERLDLSRNAVTDLSPLAGLPRLAVLVLDGNAVADLGPLTHLGRLEQLGLAGNAVVDVTPLQDLPTLRRLDLSGNAVGDLSPLGDVGALVWLALPGEAVAAAPALGRLTGLRWVWLDRGGADDARAPPGTLDGRR